jgi:uncharacterized membrane protein (DUF373 family)
MKILDEAVEAVCNLFIYMLLLIAMAVVIIIMPLWIIPYEIYKAKERGGEK